MTAPRRRWSFSLRTLLLLTVTVALGLGWAVDHQRAARRYESLEFKVGNLEERLAERTGYLGRLLKLIEGYGFQVTPTRDGWELSPPEGRKENRPAEAPAADQADGP